MDLDSFAIFKGIRHEYIALLQPLFERFTCLSGTTVIAQGAAPDFLYLVESGKVEIFFKPYDAETITVTHIETGGLFGWSAVIGDSEYTSSAVAMEYLTAMRIRGMDLRTLCADYQQAGNVILDRLAGAVSGRWTLAHEQVRAILENGLNTRNEI
jgi:CRP-like cAMP-binding protein